MENVTGSEPVGAAGGQIAGSPDAISHDPQQQQQPQCPAPPVGKSRKSAFRFFGGRRSICMLPSFFSGRAKSQGRGSSSKTGVTKSQTYDGVSRAGWEEALRGGSGDVVSADFEFHSSGDPQKAHNGLGKSQSLPRQRRGLRGLFSSIRRHRKSKNAEVEKNETLESSSGEMVPDPMASDGNGHPGEVSEPDVPTAAMTSPTFNSAADECTKRESLVPEKRRSMGKVAEHEEVVECRRNDDKEEEEETKEKGRLAIYRQPLSADSEMGRLAEANSDLPESKLPVTSATSASSDNVNLMFGDVSSLKSFDSLTGCGDIIADQDDVSVAESSVSGERGSRNAGKRSSCLVTYQGGGEEMATPDEVDSEYLHSLWESDMGSEVCYLPSEQTDEDDSASVTPDQPVSSFHATTTTNTSSSGGNTSTSPLGTTETALTPTDLLLLTPHSDRQESVPNSDEGYYDSTTPGADEDARERPRRDRLPRDSYSGDALYELYEPDDRLLSPALPSDKDECAFLLGAGQKGDLLYALASGATETEEERLSKIQHALLCCELQNLRSPSKDRYRNECFYHNDPSPLEDNCQRLAEDELDHRGAGTLKECGYGCADESSFTPNVSKTPSPLRDDLPYPPERERTRRNSEDSRGRSQSQEELMVCFSQALVDFTKNTRIYRNSTESLEGSESSSPFGPSLSTLPAIVTFDVVDMENEGECERQTDLAEDEEGEEDALASPYEPSFEDDACYLRQDAFAECDQRTFHAYDEHSLLFTNSSADTSAWGITSLPRHFGLGPGLGPRPGSGRTYPPVPVPLALNRRSRSLDTDTLDFQSSDFYTFMSSFQWRKNEAEDRRDNPGRGPGDSGRRQGRELDDSSAQRKFSNWRESSSCSSARQPTTARPSHLPLQTGCRSNTQVRGGRTGTEGPAMAGRAGGGDNNDDDASYPCSYPPSGGQWKSRPVGVTMGIPHRRPDRGEDLRESTAKSRRAETDWGAPKRTL